MKIALINDTHWGARNDSPAFIDYFNKFYDKVFFPYLQENNIKKEYLSYSQETRNFIENCIKKEKLIYNWPKIKHKEYLRLIRNEKTKRTEKEKNT